MTKYYLVKYFLNVVSNVLPIISVLGEGKVVGNPYI